uniref:Uncharacterized protein n=1 Tax=Arundo donax TaxID=35708 RepID=A0A0A9CQA3_ARUDO
MSHSSFSSILLPVMCTECPV